MGVSKSQYPGTTKDSRCTLCNENMNNKTRLEQDAHIEYHAKKDLEEVCQEKLF